MTWHSLFSLSTMENRHLIFSYGAVWAIQGGYLAWIAWNWFHTKTHRS